jgi:hypothetical protein
VSRFAPRKGLRSKLYKVTNEMPRRIDGPVLRDILDFFTVLWLVVIYLSDLVAGNADDFENSRVGTGFLSELAAREVVVERRATREH